MQKPHRLEEDNITQELNPLQSSQFFHQRIIYRTITDTMETLLRQSRSMCPFLQKTSPATLRSLSTATRRISSGGGTMSNLQVLARRCPVMGKALAVQSARTGNAALCGVFGGTRAYRSKAQLHTTRSQQATVGQDVLRRRNSGKF